MTKIFKNVKKNSKVKVISGKYKGLIDSVFFFNRKKNFVYLNNLKKSVSDNNSAGSDGKKNRKKKRKELFYSINFSNISLVSFEDNNETQAK